VKKIVQIVEFFVVARRIYRKKNFWVVRAHLLRHGHERNDSKPKETGFSAVAARVREQ
jgi:hypothetical protein